MKTVAIIQGWAGGPRLTKYFVNDLEKAGFRITHDVKSADIIIAHSAGCYRVPKKSQTKLIIFIGLPYWPGRSVFRRLLRNNRTAWKHLITRHGFGFAVRTIMWRSFYVFIKPSVTATALKSHKKLDLLKDLKDKKIILVRNQEDCFCTPDIQKFIKKFDYMSYVELPGSHDDYYDNPRPYIDLLEKNI